LVLIIILIWLIAGFIITGDIWMTVLIKMGIIPQDATAIM